MLKEKEICFDFEKLKVYQLAVEFADLIFDLCKKFDARYRSSLVDQLQRAALSISTNIAEGCGKKSRREKIKYFAYALDSAKECIPCLTIAYQQKQTSEDENMKARSTCTIICRMMGKLIQSVENEELRKGS